MQIMTGQETAEMAPQAEDEKEQAVAEAEPGLSTANPDGGDDPVGDDEEGELTEKSTTSATRTEEASTVPLDDLNGQAPSSATLAAEEDGEANEDSNDDEDDLFGDKSSVDTETPAAATPIPPQPLASVPATPASPTQTIPRKSNAVSPAVTTNSSTGSGYTPGTTYGLSAEVKIPKNIDASLLEGRLLDTLRNLPVNVVNDALTEYDDALHQKGSEIRNHGAYLYGVIKRYKSVQERAGQSDAAMGTQLTPQVQSRLDQLVTSGFCTREEMNDRVQSKIRMLSEADAIFAIDELSSVPRSQIRNFGSYFMGILNRYMRGERRSMRDRGRDRDSRGDRHGRSSRGRSPDRGSFRYDGGKDSYRRDRSRDRHSSHYGSSQPPPPPPPMNNPYGPPQSQPPMNQYMSQHQQPPPMQMQQPPQRFPQQHQQAPPMNQYMPRQQQPPPGQPPMFAAPGMQQQQAPQFSGQIVGQQQPPNMMPPQAPGMGMPPMQQPPPQHQPPLQSRWQPPPQQQQQSGPSSSAPTDIMGLADQAAKALAGSSFQQRGMQMPQSPMQQQQYGMPQQQQPPPMRGQIPGAPPSFNQYGNPNPSQQNPNRRATAKLHELPTNVQYAVQNLQASGLIPGPLDEGMLGMISDLPENLAVAALQRFMTLNRNTMRNPTAYLAGLLRRELEKIHRR